MKRSMTPTRVAEIAHEGYNFESAGLNGPSRQVMYQPAGVRLDNDGSETNWMQEGDDYTLEHDGSGWRVTCQTWPASVRSHIRRLADASKPLGSYVSTLPAVDGSGDVELEIGRIYQLRIDLGHMHLAELS